MLVARGAESPTSKEQPSGPLEPRNKEAEVNQSYKPRESEGSLRRTHENAETNGRERCKQDWRGEVKIANKYVEIKNAFILMSADFDSMWDGHQNRKTELISQDIESSQARRMRGHPILRRIARVQRHAMLRKIRSNECYQRELTTLLEPIGHY